MLSEIDFEMEMMLDAGSTDGKSLDDVASEIADTLKPVYEKVNPFDEGTTTIEVDIQSIDESGSVGNRKRRDSLRQTSSSTLIRRTARVKTKFNAEKQGQFYKNLYLQKSLSDRIQQAIRNLGNHVEHLSDEQLCNYASKSLNKGLSYISKAISSSENFMKMKGIETKKASSADKLNLSKWMDSLPENIKQLPLTLLAIPGTHQSGTSSLKKSEVVSKRKHPWDKCEGKHQSPNEEELPVFLAQTYKEWFNYQEVLTFYARDLHLGLDRKWWLPRKHPTNELTYLQAWSTCQRSSIRDQLNMGVRYFDFR